MTEDRKSSELDDTTLEQAVELLCDMKRVNTTAGYGKLSARIAAHRRRRILAAAGGVAAALLLTIAVRPQREADTGRSIANYTQEEAFEAEIAIDNGAAESGHTPSRRVVLETRRGREYKVALSDGTQVWVNSQTTLEYPEHFTGRERRVRLSGEAYFDVAHDDGRPFIVETQYARIRVLGTAFNVSAYPADHRTVTTLVAGRVEVTAGDQTVEIAPDQQAIAGRDSTVEVVGVDAAGCAAWASGTFRFENMPLEEVCTKLARWYDADLQFEFAEGTAQERFTGGTWKYVPLEDFLNVIEQATDLAFSIEGERVTVNRR